MRRVAVLASLLAGCTAAELTSPAGHVDVGNLAAKGDPTQPPACAPVTIHVRAKAKAGGNGTSKAPFTNLRDALTAAKPVACAVTIEVAAGTYEAPVEAAPLALTRAIALVGKGRPAIMESIVVETAERVHLDGVVIENAVGSGIRVNHAKADVHLERVEIRGATQFGLWQEGGTLSAAGLEISGTQSDKHLSTGTALMLTGGVRASLLSVDLHDNPRAVYAADAGTIVDIHIMQVRNSSHHPDLPAIIATGGCRALTANHLGAVEFAHGARGTGNAWVITSSDMAGLYAHDAGQVTASNVRVRETRGVGGSDGCGGYGLFAFRGGHIELSNLYIAHSAVCGAAIGSGAGSAIDLHGGAIAHAPVGACVQLPGFDTSRLRDGVDYIDVGVALTATDYPLPDLP